MDDSQESLIQARDAYSSATALALLLFGIAVLNGVTQWSQPMGPVLLSRLFVLATSLAALVYLLATRRRLNSRMALFLSVILILPLYPNLALQAVRFQQIGRPWEAFVGPPLALLAAALVVPRYFWLGVALVAAMFAEVIGIYLYLVHADGGRHLIPTTEPVFSALFALMSIALLRMRHQRRLTTARYLRAEAEKSSLERMSASLRTASEQLATTTRALAEQVGQLPQQASEGGTVHQMRGALAQLDILAGRMSALEARTPTVESETALAARSAESAFHARDAHDSVTALALFNAFAYGLAIVAARQLHDTPAVTYLILLSGFGWAAFGLLLLTRARPSQPRTIVVFLLLIVPAFPFYWYAHTVLRHSSGPLELFTGPKILMAMLPLVLPRYLWLGVATEVAIAVNAVAMFYLLGFQHQQHRLALAEPWITLVYGIIGVALLVIRDQRRVMSGRLLHADVELSSLARRSGVSVAILDQAGSPLQVLSLCVGMLESRGIDPLTLAPMKDALQKLVSASREVSNIDRSSLEASWGAFDGARELARQG